ncbi:MAG: ribokinase [Pseudomonadota bacterium]
MGKVAVLGIFVADCTFRADRAPVMGETVLGHGFALGPGGKGSNQAVAAARAGADVRFITKLGADAFAEMAETIWRDAGVQPEILVDPESYTGAASIFIEKATGNNAIIVSPGAAALLSPDDIAAKRHAITSADVFLTQLEQPIDAALAALRVAREAGVRTILNPAPAADLPDDALALSDVLTPNESEAEALTGVSVTSVESAKKAAQILVAQGAKSAIITLGEQGAFYLDAQDDGVHVPAITAGKVIETTGAGDAFNGGFATAWANGATAPEALRFATATAAISVTRPGAAASMPTKDEIELLLQTAG